MKDLKIIDISNVEFANDTCDVMLRDRSKCRYYIETHWCQLQAILKEQAQFTKDEILSRISRIPKIEMTFSDIKEALNPKDNNEVGKLMSEHLDNYFDTLN